MNTDLLLKVRDAIKAHPERFDMDTWFDNGAGHRYTTQPLNQPIGCGTTACLAGWAVSIYGVENQVDWLYRGGDIITVDQEGLNEHWDHTPIMVKARQLLGIDPTMQNLFFAAYWPDYHRHLAAMEGEAVAAVALINDLIDGRIGSTYNKLNDEHVLVEV